VDVHKLEVGKLYPSGQRSWPEGADYNWRSGGHELRIFLRRATPREVEAIRSSPVKFGLLVEPPGLFFISRFGRLSFDCSYSWHRTAETTRERSFPPLPGEMSPEARALLTIILVEASNGVVLALRSVIWSPEFTRAIHRAIHDQSSSPYDRADHEAWADRMTAEFSTEELWERSAVRCVGGA
jgi:hypothetical protein